MAEVGKLLFDNGSEMLITYGKSLYCVMNK